MSKYIINRVLTALLMFITISIISFLAGMLNGGFNIVHFESEMIKSTGGFGIDQSIHMQYLRWMGLARQEDGQFSGILEGNL